MLMPKRVKRRIGVKVWVYKGEVLKSAKNAQKKEGGNK